MTIPINLDLQAAFVFICNCVSRHKPCGNKQVFEGPQPQRSAFEAESVTVGLAEELAGLGVVRPSIRVAVVHVRTRLAVRPTCVEEEF